MGSLRRIASGELPFLRMARVGEPSFFDSTLSVVVSLFFNSDFIVAWRTSILEFFWLESSNIDVLLLTCVIERSSGVLIA